MISAEEARKIETEHWRTNKWEGPGYAGVDSLLVKAHDLRLLHQRYVIHKDLFRGTVLELGGGQLQACAMLKAERPELTVIGSDLSLDAVNMRHIWEHVFRSEVDGAFACTSDDIPLEDQSVDTVFAFQAAHHFIRHRTSLQEIHRVLKAGGIALYIQEPVCRRWCYRIMHKAANARRPDVPEDVLVWPKMLRMAQEEGFEPSITFYPPPASTGRVGVLHKALTMWVPPLGRLSFTMADLIFRKA